MKIKSVMTKAIIGCLLILSGVYSSTMNYASATSVVTITFPAGNTTTDVTYRTGIGSSNNDTTAYIVGANGGQAYVWKKNGASGLNTIAGNVTLTGSGSARAIEYNEDIIAVYVATNDKFWKLTTNLGIGGSFASGTADAVRQMIYDDTHNILYFCTTAIIGTLNQVTLSPTTVYTDSPAGGMLDCALDEANNFMYVSGSAVGASFDIIKVDLDTFTVVAGFTNTPSSILFGVCYDSLENKVWASASSDAFVRKLDSDLNSETTITVGTTPRFCSISDDSGARRLYQTNEGGDTVSIVDIDANVVLSTQTVCNLGVTSTQKLDTKRLFNTTNTYITCPANSNSVIIDDSVSETLPPEETGGSTNGRCNVGTVLDCIGDRSISTAITGGQDIGVVSGNLFCGLGLNATCSGTTKDNGTGLLLMLITGTFFAGAVISTIAIANTRFGAGISYTEIPKEFWLFLVVGVVGFAFYMQWIPDLIFYGLMVGLAGLFSFGLYKHIRGG